MQDAPASCTRHAQKENKDLSIEPARRSNNANLKFYRNAFCIAYFKINPCIFILCTMKNVYILTQALEVLEVLQVFELFVYISLPLLIHSMYSSRLFKSILYHIFMQFGRRSIVTPIDSAQSMYSFSAPVYYLYPRVVLCTRS